MWSFSGTIKWNEYKAIKIAMVMSNRRKKTIGEFKIEDIDIRQEEMFKYVGSVLTNDVKKWYWNPNIHFTDERCFTKAK